MIVDSHHHLWHADYDWLADDSLAPIRRDYTVADLRAVLTAAGVDRTVLVEAARCHADEACEFLNLAHTTPEIGGVVAWASIVDPAIADTIAGYRELPGGRWLFGIRDQIQSVADPDHLDRRDVRAGIAAVGAHGLVFDLVVRPDQLPACARAAAALPDVTLVLDHLGKPRIVEGAEGLARWRAQLAPLAASPNVVCKLSGLVTEADWARWTVDDLRPFVEVAVELFGPDRLMFGSDWPVCELAAPYVKVLDAMRTCLDWLSPAEHEAIFARTAIRTYGLEI
jgi:L-fuconolactonase